MNAKTTLKSVEIAKIRFRLAVKRIVQVIHEPNIYLALFADAIFIMLLLANSPVNQLDSSTILAVVGGAFVALLDYIVIRSLRSFSRGLLSNVYSLFILSLATYILAILHLNTFLVAFCTGMVISLNSALWGDLFSKGNYDNWLWVLRDEHIIWLRYKLGSHLLGFVTLFFLFIIGSYVIAFFELWITFSHNSAGFAWILNWQWIRDPHKVGMIGAIILFAFVVWLTTNCLVSIRKYHLLSSENKLRISSDSLRLIYEKYVQRKGNISSNHIVKQIQRDQLFWALLLAIAITILEIAIFISYPNQGLAFEFFFFMAPLTIVLLFGIVGHTTSCQLGGAYGVLLAAFCIRLIVMISPQYSWNAELLFVIFSSAIVAWIVGLLSTSFIRGTQRMSLLTFVIRVDFGKRSTCTPDFLRAVRNSLEEGYLQGMQYIGDISPKKTKATLNLDTGLSITTEDDISLFADKEYRFSISHSQIPLLKQIYYALCLNRLTKGAGQDNNSIPLPTLPLAYHHPGYAHQYELDAVGMPDGAYHFLFPERSHYIQLPSFINHAKHNGSASYGYRKDISEFFDDMLTLSVNIQTDLFLYLNNQSNDKGNTTELCFVGFCRGTTSTKSYVTLESEIIANEVIDSLIKKLNGCNLQPQIVQRARLHYPKISIYDWSTDLDETSTIASSSTTPFAVALPASILEFIRRGLQQLPEKAPFTTLTQNLRKRLLVSITEVSIAGLITLINLGQPVSRILQAIFKDIFS